LIAFIAPAMLMVMAACEREDRDSRTAPVSESPPTSITMGALFAGGTKPPPPSPQRGYYEVRAYDVSEGKRLFQWFNCNGCHANGGGDKGPALMDDKWLYGGQIENIYATIVQGRPNGMPSFRNKIPEQQVWQLASYVRSLSGQLRKDVEPGRLDDLSARPSEQRTPRSVPGSGQPTSTEGRQ
jgi:cytochrome c oxidase cbb3-type subunit 3